MKTIAMIVGSVHTSHSLAGDDSGEQDLDSPTHREKKTHLKVEKQEGK